MGFGVASSSTSRYGHYQVQMFSSVAGPATATPPATPTPPVDDTTGDTGTGTDGDEGTRTPSALQARLAGVRVTVGRVRCRGARAIAGWCWRSVTTGALRTTTGEGVGPAAITVTRHSRAARRFVPAGRAVTRADGSFRLVVPLAAPRRRTATWLLRETRLWHLDAGATAVRVVARR